MTADLRFVLMSSAVAAGLVGCTSPDPAERDVDPQALAQGADDFTDALRDQTDRRIAEYSSAGQELMAGYLTLVNEPNDLIQTHPTHASSADHAPQLFPRVFRPCVVGASAWRDVGDAAWMRGGAVGGGIEPDVPFADADESAWLVPVILDDRGLLAGAQLPDDLTGALVPPGSADGEEIGTDLLGLHREVRTPILLDRLAFFLHEWGEARDGGVALLPVTNIRGDARAFRTTGARAFSVERGPSPQDGYAVSLVERDLADASLQSFVTEVPVGRRRRISMRRPDVWGANSFVMLHCGTVSNVAEMRGRSFLRERGVVSSLARRRLHTGLHDGGFYDIRIVPRLPLPATLHIAEPEPGDLRVEDLLYHLRHGEWLRAADACAALDELFGGGGGAGRLSRARDQLAHVVRSARHDYALNFRADRIEDVADACESLLDELDEAVERRVDHLPRGSFDELRWACTAIWAAEHEPCPVLFDDWRVRPEEGLETDAAQAPDVPDFSFIAAADIQFVREFGQLETFLRMLDPAYPAPNAPRSAEETWREAVPDPNRRRLLRRLTERAKFLVLGGDLSDARASNDSFNLGLNALGLKGATSPYTETTRSSAGDLVWDSVWGIPRAEGSFIELKSAFCKLRRPVFAVPGNHDGYMQTVGIPGALLGFPAWMLDEAFDAVGVETSLQASVYAWTPTLVKANVFQSVLNFFAIPFQSDDDEPATSSTVPIRVTTPVYDGLLEWQRHLGPQNFAFRFRGHSFVGFNTYALQPEVRDGVGPIVFYGGGGVSPVDTMWLDAALQWTRAPLAHPFCDDPHRSGSQLIFMHHDPRGAWAKEKKTPTDLAVPSLCEADAGRDPEDPDFRRELEERQGSEEGWGRYDQIDATVQKWLLGYPGLGYSPSSGIFIPLLTPGVHLGLRELFSGRNENMTWLRIDEDDQEMHGARHTIEAINANLPSCEGGVSPDGRGARPEFTHLFFGHDDVATESCWSVGGDVFHGETYAPGAAWSAASVVVKLWNPGAPVWALHEGVFVPESVGEVPVTRLDSIGQSSDAKRGFHVVTVRSGKPPLVRWVRLPPPPEAD